MYFNDGSFWVMGQMSGAAEQDAGTRYPTIVEDSNGNQVAINYQADSARITGIGDVRGSSYSFTYSTVNGFDHLTGISNLINTNESYTLNYSSGQTLYSPFTSPVNYGSIALLTSVVQNGVGLTQSFEYDNNGPGELRKAIFPYKGELRWDYRSFTYTSSRTLREAQYRYLVQSNGATPLTYTITHDDTGDASLNTHAWTKLADAGGVGGKKWTFETTTSSAYFGLETKYEGIALPSTTISQADYTWAQDSISRVYLGATLSTLDPGQTYTKQSKVEQTVDVYGNVTQKKIYDFGNLTTAARTFNTSYLATTAT